MIDIETIDREAILYLIQELENFEKNKALRGGLSDAVLVFKTIGRSNLRKRMKRPEGVTGNLLAAFKTRVKKSKPGALSGFHYSRSKLEWPEGSHAHIVDRGTGSRRTGVMPALRFWEDAVSQGESKAMQSLYIGIERAVQRINNRQK